MRAFEIAGVALFVAFTQGARADESLGPSLAGGALSDLLQTAEGRLLHGGSGGYHVSGGPLSGYLVGVDVGAALPLATGGVEAQPSVSLAARFGYQFENGLSLALRYEDLGLSPNLIDGAQLQFIAVNARYSFPFIFPMPFVEADIGLSIATSDGPLGPGQGSTSAGPGGALGVGVSFPVTHHFAIDVSARDWLAPVAGEVFQIFSVEAGVWFAFGGAGK